MRKVTAIIRGSALEGVEAALQRLGVSGVSVSAVKGYGEQANFFTHDWMVTHTKLETFVPDAESERVVRAICDAARTGAPGDGIVAVQPADDVVRIRTAEAVRASVSREPLDVAPQQVEAAAASNRGQRLARAAVSVALVISLLAAVLVSAQHKLHFLTAVLAGALVLYAALGLWANRGDRGGDGRAPGRRERSGVAATNRERSLTS